MASSFWARSALCGLLAGSLPGLVRAVDGNQTLLTPSPTSQGRPLPRGIVRTFTYVEVDGNGGGSDVTRSSTDLVTLFGPTPTGSAGLPPTDFDTDTVTRSGTKPAGITDLPLFKDPTKYGVITPINGNVTSTTHQTGQGFFTPFILPPGYSTVLTVPPSSKMPSPMAEPVATMVPSSGVNVPFPSGAQFSRTTANATALNSATSLTLNTTAGPASLNSITAGTTPFSSILTGTMSVNSTASANSLTSVDRITTTSTPADPGTPVNISGTVIAAVTTDGSTFSATFVPTTISDFTSLTTSTTITTTGKDGEKTPVAVFPFGLAWGLLGVPGAGGMAVPPPLVPPGGSQGQNREPSESVSSQQTASSSTSSASSSSSSSSSTCAVCMSCTYVANPAPTASDDIADPFPQFADTGIFYPDDLGLTGNSTGNSTSVMMTPSASSVGNKVSASTFANSSSVAVPNRTSNVTIPGPTPARNFTGSIHSTQVSNETSNRTSTLSTSLIETAIKSLPAGTNSTASRDSISPVQINLPFVNATNTSDPSSPSSGFNVSTFLIGATVIFNTSSRDATPLSKATVLKPGFQSSIATISVDSSITTPVYSVNASISTHPPAISAETVPNESGAITRVPFANSTHHPEVDNSVTITLTPLTILSQSTPLITPSSSADTSPVIDPSHELPLPGGIDPPGLIRFNTTTGPGPPNGVHGTSGDPREGSNKIGRGSLKSSPGTPKSSTGDPISSPAVSKALPDSPPPLSSHLGPSQVGPRAFVNEPPLLKALRSRIAREAGSYFERRTAAEAKRLQLEWRELERRKHLEARGGAGRINFCGRRENAPKYNSWFRVPSNTPTTSIPAGREGVGRSTLPWAADWRTRRKLTQHIFEIQLISDYFKYMEKNDASIRSIMTTFNRDACAAIYRPLLFPTKQWATTDWAGLQAPFKDFAAAISGGQAHSDEFVFLENGVNSMKGSMFNGDIPKPKGNPLDNYVLVVRMALVFEYMRDVKVVDSWTKSSDRFFDACLRLESAIKTSPTFVSGSWQSIQWTSGYRTREAQMLLDVQTKARGARDTLMALAISQATTNEAAARTPAERALWTKMKSELQTAKTRLFSDAAFTIDKI